MWLSVSGLGGIAFVAGVVALGLLGLRWLIARGAAEHRQRAGPCPGTAVIGQRIQQEVYGKGDTRPGILYTTITSTHDEIVTPYTQQALSGANVTNIVIQDRYPGLPVGHLGVVLSPQAELPWEAAVG